MGTKRPIDSGRVDKNGKKIMVSENSAQNYDVKKSAIQGGVLFLLLKRYLKETNM